MDIARVRGMDLAYDDVGSGPAVVLLHGYPFNRSMWREQTEALKDSHRVIAPDLRGLGETTVDAGPSTMEEMARDVASLMDELQIEKAVLCGLSMGGYVAFAFYSLFPERVSALVLADTRPQGDTEEGREGREEQARKILAGGMEAIADDFLKKVLTPATLYERPEVVARVREMVISTDPRGAAAALRGMAGRPDRTGLLRSINVPALVVVGSLDPLTPPEDARGMAAKIEGSRLEVIEGASHLSNLERPAEFNRALETFLRGLQP